MRLKYVILAVFSGCLLLNSLVGAVDTKAIDEVRNKGLLDSEDLKIIDEFMSAAIGELVVTRDFSGISNIHTMILSRKSTQSQYAEQFSESSYKYLYTSLKELSTFPAKEYRYETVVNLLILLDGLGDVRLVELGIGMLKDKNMVVRYWAVRSVTNPVILSQLTSSSSGDMKLCKQIAEELKQIIDSSSVEILAMAAEFGATVNIKEGKELLLQIADKRMKEYAEWTVSYELLDGSILKLLYNKLTSEGASDPAIARRFGQLYSYLLQRYVKGREFLSVTEKSYLTSALVEVEKLCISELLGIPQSVIKKAIESDSYMGLLEEHSRLLGDNQQAGQLGLKLGFDYGEGPDGVRVLAPLSLAELPE